MRAAPKALNAQHPLAGTTTTVRLVPSPSHQRPHLRLGLLQPEPHVHLAVHRRRGGQMLLRLLALAGAPEELGEAEVAVGDEGAHAELAGERQRLAVVA